MSALCENFKARVFNLARETVEYGEYTYRDIEIECLNCGATYLKQASKGQPETHIGTWVEAHRAPKIEVIREDRA